MRDELEVGARFPDLCLPDHNGNRRSLSALAGDDPLLLQFSRGWWCPKERTFFRQLVELQADAEAAYTRMVTVTVDPPEVLAAFRAGLDARWTFLSDHDRRYITELQLKETTDTLNEPYTPVVFVLHPDLTIHRIYHGYWYWGRPSNHELRCDLRELTREVRDRWEVSGT